MLSEFPLGTVPVKQPAGVDHITTTIRRGKRGHRSNLCS